MDRAFLSLVKVHGLFSSQRWMIQPAPCFCFFPVENVLLTPDFLLVAAALPIFHNFAPPATFITKK
jgi:hypothetical protein